MKKLSRLLTLLLCLTACATVEATPKSRIESCVGALVQAYQNKDERAFMARISKDYSDRAGLENRLMNAFLTHIDIRVSRAGVSNIVYENGAWSADVRVDYSFDRRIDEHDPFERVRTSVAGRAVFKAENKTLVVTRFDKFK